MSARASFPASGSGGGTWNLGLGGDGSRGGVGSLATAADSAFPDLLGAGGGGGAPPRRGAGGGGGALEPVPLTGGGGGGGVECFV